MQLREIETDGVRNLYEGELNKHWTIGPKVHGGAMVALCANAARTAHGGPVDLAPNDGLLFHIRTGADPDRAAKVAARVRAGTINVNGGVWYSADAPFGGYKQSGNGREMGVAGFEEYLEIKTIATAVN